MKENKPIVFQGGTIPYSKRPYLGRKIGAMVVWVCNAVLRSKIVRGDSDKVTIDERGGLVFQIKDSSNSSATGGIGWRFRGAWDVNGDLGAGPSPKAYKRGDIVLQELPEPDPLEIGVGIMMFIWWSDDSSATPQPEFPLPGGLALMPDEDDLTQQLGWVPISFLPSQVLTDGADEFVSDNITIKTSGGDRVFHFINGSLQLVE